MRLATLLLLLSFVQPGLLLPATPPVIDLVKSMNPAAVFPGDTVTICLTFSSPPGTPKADIVWVLDRTGSMGSKINQIVANITQFTSQLAATGIDYRNGLVYYPQSNDTGSVTQGWATSDAQFSSWLTAVAGATCCGNEPSLAAMQAAAAMTFRSDATKTIILVTDENVDCQEKNPSYPQQLSSTVSTLYSQGFVIHAIACDCAVSYNCSYDCSYRCNATSIPALANGIFLDINSPVSAWSGFLTQLGAAVASFSNVVITDPLPPQLVPIPGTLEGGSLSGNTVTWTFSTVGRGDSITRCMLSVAGPGYTGAITNTASASADGVSPTSGGAVPIYYVTPTPTITPTFTQTLTYSITPSHTVTPTYTITLSHTVTSTLTVTNSFTYSPTLTPTPTITPSFTVTPTLTPTTPPLTLILHPPNPNPSNNGVWLPYSIGTNADVDIQVWTISGEPVRELKPGFQLLGTHEEFWDHRNEAGNKVGSGIYVYRVKARSLAAEERKEFGKCAVAR